jgi:hypothetical protein
MSTTKDWLPLFPLDLALLPGALLPLHVFEPRYRALVRLSLEGDRPFGMVRMHDGNLAPVGCGARIVQVLQAYPDGRSDILVRGEERFSLLDLREHADGYLEGRAVVVHDEPDSAPDPEDRRLLERLVREYAQLADDDGLPGGVPGAADAEGLLGEAGAGPDEGTAPEDATALAEGTIGGETSPHGAVEADIARDVDPDADADLERFSFALAARVPLGVDERQALLETLSERERTTALLGHLARLVPRLRAHEKDRRKVRGNGKPIPAEE